MLRLERLGRNLVGRMIPYHGYMIDVTGLDMLSLGDLGGGSNALASLVLLEVLG